MTEDEFKTLYDLVKKSNTSSMDQSAIIIEAMKEGNVLTVAQAMELLNLMRFDDEYKVNAAFEIYLTVYDTKNRYQVYTLFRFSDNKGKLLEKVEANRRC